MHSSQTSGSVFLLRAMELRLVARDGSVTRDGLPSRKRGNEIFACQQRRKIEDRDP